MRNQKFLPVIPTRAICNFDGPLGDGKTLEPRRNFCRATLACDKKNDHNFFFAKLAV